MSSSRFQLSDSRRLSYQLDIHASDRGYLHSIRQPFVLDPAELAKKPFALHWQLPRSRRYAKRVYEMWLTTSRAAIFGHNDSRGIAAWTKGNMLQPVYRFCGTMTTQESNLSVSMAPFHPLSWVSWWHKGCMGKNTRSWVQTANMTCRDHDTNFNRR